MGYLKENKMKYSQAQLKKIVNEEIQNEIQSLDEGLGDIIKSVGKFFNAKYRQFKGLASSLGDTPQFWSKIKPVIAQDGMAAAKATASNKGNWSFDTYIMDSGGKRTHIWKILSSKDGPLELTPSRHKMASISGPSGNYSDAIDLSDVYSDSVRGDVASAMVYLAETVDVLAALTAIMDAGKATQATVAKAQQVRRFVDEEIDDIRRDAFRQLARLGRYDTYEPGSGDSPGQARRKATYQAQRDAGEALQEYGYKGMDDEEFASQLSDSDKKKFLSISNDIEARFKDLLGQAEAIEQKLINDFKKGAMQAELPRSAPELQEQKNKIVIKITPNKEK
jgi:hypothetical protein